MIALLGALIVAAAVVAAGWRIASALTARRRADALALLRLFAEGIVQAQRDPRALLVWQPLARTARRVDPEAFAVLERASDGTFPFTGAQIEAAHARWTADWLAWEGSHDAEFKFRAAALEREGDAIGPELLRARLAALEREKLESYQRRYQEYVDVAKALQALKAG